MGSLQAPLPFIFHRKDCIRNQCTECTFGENNKLKHKMKSELNGIIALENPYIQLFRERLSEKCARDNPER